MQKYKQLSEKAGLYELFDFFCGQIDFDSSPLDGDGIFAMNELSIRLRKLETEDEAKTRKGDIG